jgi:hypothetical protein
MAQEAVVLKFPGKPEEVAGCYAEGLRRFRAANPGVAPETLFVGRSDAEPEGLAVVLLWPDGVSHETLGRFLLKELRELGLQRPRAEHVSVMASGWDTVSALRKP